MNTWPIRKIVIFCFVFTGLFLLFSCAKKPSAPSDTRDVLGTRVTITIYDEGQTAGNVERVFNQAFTTMSHWEAMTITPGAANQVYKVSEGAGTQSIQIDPDVFELLMAATRLHDQSGEFFDVRIGPLFDAWGFDGSPHVPGSADLDSAIALVRDGGMFVAGKSILLAKQGMRFDVREFVEGYVFDRIAEQLQEKGFRNFVIHSPRVWRTVGTAPDEKGFELKLTHPFIADSIWMTLNVADGGFAYLSPTRDMFTEGGKRYHGLLNPYTGMPGERLAGVVVAAEDAATAQAMAYAEFVRAENDTIPEKGAVKIKGSLEIREQAGSFSTTASGTLAASFESH